jgi:predicted regulator of Ras-like GTPase activity (Roadblock/LC7/MglB family)
MSSGSGFWPILRDVVERLPGARGAVFVDWEGECVDAACAASVDGTELRIAGAQWCINYRQVMAIAERLALGPAEELVLRFAGQQIVVRRVTDEYVVVLALGNEANLGRALHLARLASAGLREEM